MLNSKIQSKENENTQLKKEIENLQKQLKTNNVSINQNELKLIKAQEECEKLKGTVKSLKQEDKVI